MHFPQDKLIYLKDIKGLKVRKDADVYEIEFEFTQENLMEFFYAGAQFGMDKLNNYLFHQKITK